MVYRVEAEPGKPITVTKIVSYHTSRGVPVRELVDRCRRTLDRVARAGRRAAVRRPAAVAGRVLGTRRTSRSPASPTVQQAIRWNLFQLAQATGRAEQSGVPAKGVTGSGYGGHYFWDTEIYVLPFLTYTSPRMARSALRFRYNMLDAARRRAEDLAQRARCSRGGRSTARRRAAYYAAGTAQYHIDADIAYALMQVRDRQRRRRVHAPRGRRHPGRDGADVGRSRVLAGAQRVRRSGPHVPHPRRDRAGRVHHRGQRQPVHQRDGAVQPGQGRRGRPAAGRRATACCSTGWSIGWDWISGRSTSGRRRPRRCPSRTTTAPGSTRRTRTSWTGRCGT